MTCFVSINGQPVAPEHAIISLFDRGFTLGDGLFETIKLEHGVAWYLDRHLARIERSANQVGIAYPDHLRTWIEAAIMASPRVSDSFFVLRITLTRGPSHTPGLAGSNDSLPTTVITVVSAPLITPQIYQTGLSVCIASAPRNERAFSAGIKSTSYIEPVLALREAKATGYEDAIFLDSRGFVSEASASNVFARIDDTLVTPPMSCGILPGITRAVVLELATHQAIPTAEREFTVSELLGAQEVFCTSSLRGIAPIVRVDGTAIHTGAPGMWTNQLMAEYSAQTTRK